MLDKVVTAASDGSSPSNLSAVLRRVGQLVTCLVCRTGLVTVLGRHAAANVPLRNARVARHPPRPQEEAAPSSDGEAGAR